MFPLLCVDMKIKHHTVFITQKNLLKTILIYYLRILKIPIIFLIKDLNMCMTNKRKLHGKRFFVNIAYNIFFAQKCLSLT